MLATAWILSLVAIPWCCGAWPLWLRLLGSVVFLAALWLARRHAPGLTGGGATLALRRASESEVTWMLDGNAIDIQKVARVGTLGWILVFASAAPDGRPRAVRPLWFDANAGERRELRVMAREITALRSEQGFAT